MKNHLKNKNYLISSKHPPGFNFRLSVKHMPKPSQKARSTYQSTTATLSGWGFGLAGWIQDSCRVWKNQAQMKLGVQQPKGLLSYSQVEGGCSEPARLWAGKRTSSCGLQSSVSYLSFDPRVCLAIDVTSLEAPLPRLFQQKKLNSDFSCMCWAHQDQFHWFPWKTCQDFIALMLSKIFPSEFCDIWYFYLKPVYRNHEIPWKCLF